MEALKPEDLKVGMKVMVTENIRTGDRSYLNMVMTIQAIDLPYIIVEHKDWFGPKMVNTSVLTTEYCFAEPSPEFVQLMEAKNVE